ncbi:protein-disulfide reductase DsbD domain-containing protein [Hoeflea sp.]|uniref:protein-disulfide reductase DsbD domain-containing protein n=1 Tax=Hoeflea sp. TaxID=1940281 RepID=UPI003748C3DE
MLVIALAIVPAWALESAWAETEGGRMRLVVDPAPRADGTIMAVLDVDLDAGWKTYWRDPGSAGIPPIVDFSQSKGIDLEAFDYPPPVRVDDGYAIWSGYTAPVRFPLVLKRTASGPAQIRALAFIGICEKICVPFQAELEVDLPQDAVTSKSARMLVDAAIASLPEPMGADFHLTDVHVNSDQIEIAVALPAFRPASVKPDLFVSGPPGFAFAPPRLISDSDGEARWSVRVERRPENASDIDLDAINAVITFGRRAMSDNLGNVPAAAN